MRSILRIALSIAFLIISPLSATRSEAQTVSLDGSTNTNVSLDSQQQQFTIEQGTVRGQNLFHSFDEFSPESWSVVFDLSDSQYDNIDVVIGRVTGTQRTLIDGELQMLGGQAPDLWLINPSGITFGENARLQLPGSFVASTAEHVFFDQAVLEATAVTAVPLLAVSRPTGLQLGMQSSDIAVVGQGHSLTAADPLLAPYISSQVDGIRVDAQKTLALISNGIDIDGGVLSALSGHIELGSVAAGSVVVAGVDNPGQVTRLAFDYSSASQFGNIQLRDSALADVSSAVQGVASGSLQAFGESIELYSGSGLINQNNGFSRGGDVVVQASDELLISGISQDERLISSALISEAVFLGDTGDLSITTPRITIESGGIAGSRTFAPGNAGLLTLNADVIDVRGHAPTAPSLVTRLGSYSMGSGSGGDIIVPDAQALLINEGSFFGSATFRDGLGGDVYVKADDIVVEGSSPTDEQSLLVALTIGGTGDAGDLTIETERLRVESGGMLVTSSYTDGSAGDITITASESVIVGDSIPGLAPSQIASGVSIAPPVYRAISGDAIPTGAAGQLSIRAPRVQIKNGGSIHVANYGTGDAGVLEIVAEDTIDVSRRGNISALTTSGAQGDLSLETNILRMSEESLIQATSLGDQDGGNVEIKATFLIGTGNSDIVANAVAGRGGNIDITAQGIFGFQFRNQLTAQSDITASSELGLDGRVEIEYAGLDLSASLAALPAYFSDVDNQVAASCSTGNGNQFVASGRGGLATQPTDTITTNSPWTDIRSPSEPTESGGDPSFTSSLDDGSQKDQTTVLIEATHWSRNEEGEVSFVTPQTESPARTMASHCINRA